MNKTQQQKKESGSYYTPQLLADYIIYRLFDEGAYKFGKEIEVLEPSVGDGIFLDATLNGNYYKDQTRKFKKKIPYVHIDAIEINPEVARSTQSKSKKYDQKKGKVNVISENYLDYFLNGSKKYDLIIGNPPYVRRRNMSMGQRKLCGQVHKDAGLKDINPKNLWTSFFAGAKESLKDKGVIAFVLPTDLLQVKYSEEIREILQRDFERVEIFTLNWIYFDDIEQDVVILICSNGHGKTDGLRFIHINSLDDLEKPKYFEDHDNSRRPTLNKWTNYVLSKEEFNFLDNIHRKINPKNVRYYCDSGAGIVTAANDFFIINQQVVDEFSLHDVTKLTIKKSSSMLPSVILKKKDLLRKAQEGAEVFFTDFPDKPKNELPNNYKRYLKLGEEQNLHLRYKMLLRTNWYTIPSVWSSEAFFTKRSNVYPRIVINQASAHVTDAFYRIRMRDNYKVNVFAFSFYNTFSFIYAELSGRYYGGGVLELTPNEFKSLPIPYVSDVTDLQIKNLDLLTRNGKKLHEILDYSDEIILQKRYNLTRNEVVKLRKIYQKLLQRRLKKSSVEIG